MSAARPVRATAAATMTVTLPPLPATSHSICPGSRACPLRPPSSSGIAAGKAAWRRSELNKNAYVHIEDRRNRPLQGGRYPYVYVDGIYQHRNRGGKYENVAILVAIAVNKDGFYEVLDATEGMKG
jgi:hypothetical protein